MGDVIRIMDARQPARNSSVLFLAFQAAKREADRLQTFNAYRRAVEAYDRWLEVYLAEEA